MHLNKVQFFIAKLVGAQGLRPPLYFISTRIAVVYNVNDMGWRGLKDREILDLAEKYPFDAFITADKNLPYQQNLTNIILRIIILDSRSTRPD